MDVSLEILRFDPEKDREPHFESYTVQADPMNTLLGCLHTIKWYQDSSLALRRSSAHGVCGSDAMLINGENTLACKSLVKDLKQPIRIEPLRGLPMVKDLVVDMDPFFDGYLAVKPWLITDEKEREPDARGSSLPKIASGSTTPPNASCAPRAPRRVPSTGRTSNTWAPLQ